MQCPECKKSETSVIDSRDDSRQVRRRRSCKKCGYRFTTYERFEAPKIQIMKRNGILEDYHRNKLAHGIRLSLEKRPVTSLQIEDLIDEIEHDLVKLKAKIVSSKQVGNLTLHRLKKFDEVAYLRFLSVYKSFGSASKFHKEAEKLVNK